MAGWAAAAHWYGGGDGGVPTVLSLLWASAVGLAAAEGPPALLAAMRPGHGSSRGTAGSREQGWACTAAAGVVAAVLQGAQLLMGQWVRCCAFMLAVVPLYGLATGQHGAVGRAATLAAAAGASMAAASPWLAPLVLPHVLLTASLALLA